MVERYSPAPRAHFLQGCGTQILYPSATGKSPAPGNLALKHTTQELSGSETESRPDTQKVKPTA